MMFVFLDLQVVNLFLSIGSCFLWVSCFLFLFLLSFCLLYGMGMLLVC